MQASPLCKPQPFIAPSRGRSGRHVHPGPRFTTRRYPCCRDTGQGANPCRELPQTWVGDVGMRPGPVHGANLGHGGTKQSDAFCGGSRVGVLCSLQPRGEGSRNQQGGHKHGLVWSTNRPEASAEEAGTPLQTDACCRAGGCRFCSPVPSMLHARLLPRPPQAVHTALVPLPERVGKEDSRGCRLPRQACRGA